MSSFIVVEGHTTSVGGPTAWLHPGDTNPLVALGALPGANVVTAGRSVWAGATSLTVLDRIFVFQHDRIFKSTDEGATFILEPTLGVLPNFNAGGAVGIAPVPVMLNGALKYYGFHHGLAGNAVMRIEYDVATDTWTSVDTGVTSGGGASSVQPVEFEGRIYGTRGNLDFVFDPSIGSMASLGDPGTLDYRSRLIPWNGNMYLFYGILGNLYQLVGATYTLVTSLDAFGVGSQGSPAVFVDPNTNNLIALWHDSSGNPKSFSVTPGHVVTNINAIEGVAWTAFPATVRLNPVVSRAVGGAVSVAIYAGTGVGIGNPFQRFDWVNDATPMNEVGVIAGTGDFFFPTSISDGGEQLLFTPTGKRVLQTAQVDNVNGIQMTMEAFQSGGGTMSVRQRHRNVSDVKNIPLTPSTILNPAGTGGLSLTGGNPGAQVDGVPANKTPITYEWDAVADGFGLGDTYDVQIEAF